MPQKTFGPFSGMQLTVMFVAALAFMLPTTLWAVDAYQNVAIQDPLSGRKAFINSARRLSVSDGPALMDENPVNFVRFSRQATQNCIRIATPPAGKSLIIKTLVVNTWYNPTPGNAFSAALYIDASCSLYFLNVNQPGIGVTAIPYEPGLVVRPGKSLWAKEFGVEAEVSGTGYLVAASWTPVPPSVAPVSASAASQSQQR